MSTVLTLIAVLLVAEMVGLMLLFVAYVVSRIKENMNNRRIENGHILTHRV